VPAGSPGQGGIDMLAMQESKYDAIDGRLVNRATGVPIPDDEPVFVLRAKDLHALTAIQAYATVLPPGPHHEAVVTRMFEFDAFRYGKPERMREPDTQPFDGGRKSVIPFPEVVGWQIFTVMGEFLLLETNEEQADYRRERGYTVIPCLPIAPPPPCLIPPENRGKFESPN
jgi:hypothetical protein